MSNIDISSNFNRPDNSRFIAQSNSILPSNTDSCVNVNNNSMLSKKIDDSYKQYISSIDLSLLDDETRQTVQRITLLDNELDKLHRMNAELNKNSERRSRRHSSTKVKDPLLRENENLQNKLIDYIKTLKTKVVNNYPAYTFSNSTIMGR